MLDSTLLHRGAIAATDYRCGLGPHDTPFPELHEMFSVSYVRGGSFGYHTRGKAFDLVAGSVLIGYPGDEYLCTHDHHGGGDECLAFHFEPEVVESLGARLGNAPTPCLPPLPELMVLGVRAQAAVPECADREGHTLRSSDGVSGPSATRLIRQQYETDPGLDELGLMLAARVARIVTQVRPKPVRPTPSDRRRAVESALWLEANAPAEVDLQRTAAVAGLSAFHFLRVFGSVIGVTPHQYLVRCRLQRAARALAEDDRNITEIAFDCGFGDISNFVRTFRRAAGATPSEFRRLSRVTRAPGFARR